MNNWINQENDFFAFVLHMQKQSIRDVQVWAHALTSLCFLGQESSLHLVRTTTLTNPKSGAPALDWLLT